MIMLFNEFLDMPHLSGGWIVLAGEMLANRDVNKFVHTFFCVYGKCLGYFISTHETWDQPFPWCVYIFVQCTFL